MIRLQLFGTIELRDPSGNEINSVLAQPKRTALLSYLATAGPGSLHRRGTLLALLWSELDEARARNALSKSLHHLRRSLGGDAIVVRANEEVGLSAERVWCDVAAFQAAVDTGHYEVAADLYARGPLMDGFAVSEAPEFEDWLDRTRTSLRQRALDAARKLTEAAANKQDITAAVKCARLAVQLGLYDEAALRRLVQLLDGSGDRAGAVAEYEAFASRLRSDLELEPSPETQALARAIRSRSDTDSAALTSTNTQSPAEKLEVLPVRALSDSFPWARRGRRRWAVGILAATPLLVGSALAAAHGGWWSAKDQPSIAALLAPLPTRTVAVLPFVNLSPDTSTSYFSDGITEDLITQLAKLKGIRVPSRTDVFRYKGSDKTMREIARELGATELVEGSVRRDEDRVRVVVQLIDAAAGHHLWAQTYDRPLGDVLAVQGEIAHRIASALGTEHQEASTGMSRAVNSMAYDYVQRARQIWNTAGSTSTFSAHDSVMVLVRRAIELDPEYAPAHAVLSGALESRYWRGDGAVWSDSAIAAGEEAVRLDPELPLARHALSMRYRDRGWYGRARAQEELAVQLDPNYTYALHHLGVYLFYEGRLDESMVILSRMERLESRREFPALPWRFSHSAKTLLVLGDLESAEAWARKSIDLVPEHDEGYRLLAEIRLLQGRSDEARAALAMRLATGHGGSAYEPNRYTPALLESALGDLALVEGNDTRAAELYQQTLDAHAEAASLPAYILPNQFLKNNRPWGIEDGWFVGTSLGYVRWRQGRYDEANELLSKSESVDRESLAAGHDSWVIPYDLAAVSAIRGETADALRWLERARAAGFRNFRFLLLDPRLESLREEARFNKLVAGIRSDVARMRRLAPGIANW